MVQMLQVRKGKHPSNCAGFILPHSTGFEQVLVFSSSRVIYSDVRNRVLWRDERFSPLLFPDMSELFLSATHFLVVDVHATIPTSFLANKKGTSTASEA